MKSFVTAFLFCVVGLCAAQKYDKFDFHVANVALLQSKAIQTELKISEAQRKQMNVFADKHRGRLAAYQKELQAAKQTQADPQRLVGYLGDLKEGVFAQLSSAQLKRLREITLQMIGITAVVDPVVGKRLGLSAAQQKKVREAFAAGTKSLAQAEQAIAQGVLAKYKDKKAKDKAEAEKLAKQAQSELAAAAQRAQPRLKKLAEQRNSKVKAVLTAKQISSFTALQGKKYSGKI